jgi:hypothetical protein
LGAHGLASLGAAQYFLSAEGIKENEEFLENLLWTGHTYHKYVPATHTGPLTPHTR